MADNLLEVRGLKKYFKTGRGIVHAVDDVTFTIERGKTLGVVGESGCGKSTLGRNVLRLQNPTDGEVIYDGVDITNLTMREMKAKRKDMQIIFQDPYSSLNPRKTVYEIIAEPLIFNKVFKGQPKDALEKRVRELMDTVGLAQRLINSYPHELDGGRRQRIGIARALALDPKFIVCDEPVSALDVSIQAQILNLLKELQKDRNLTYMFISHDMSVIRYTGKRVGVMYLGHLVEESDTDELFAHPCHPYTQVLLSAVPSPNPHVKKERIILQGDLPSPLHPPTGCVFHTRCPYATQECSTVVPEMKRVGVGHCVACHHVVAEDASFKKDALDPASLDKKNPEITPYEAAHRNE